MLQTFFLVAKTNLRSRSEELNLATDQDSVEAERGNENIDWKSFEEAVGNEIKKTGKIIVHVATTLLSSCKTCYDKPRSHVLQQFLDDKSVASYQQALCKLIVKSCYPQILFGSLQISTSGNNLRMTSCSKPDFNRLVLQLDETDKLATILCRFWLCRGAHILIVIVFVGEVFVIKRRGPGMRNVQ